MLAHRGDKPNLTHKTRNSICLEKLGKDKSKVKSRKGSSDGFVLDVQCRCKFGSFTISSNSRCHLASCILSVLALFSDSRMSISFLQNM